MPIPLSWTAKAQESFFRSAVIVTRGDRSGLRYLIAFPTMFWKSCCRWARCIHNTCGKAAAVT